MCMALGVPARPTLLIEVAGQLSGPKSSSERAPTKRTVAPPGLVVLRIRSSAQPQACPSVIWGIDRPPK
jgi:hypothetical protein